QERLSVVRRVHLRYDGTDSALIVNFGSVAEMTQSFEAAYRSRYSFLMPGRALIAESVSVEAFGAAVVPPEPADDNARGAGPAAAADWVSLHTGGRAHRAPVFVRERLGAGDGIPGPAVIAEKNATTVVEPGWRAEVMRSDRLVLERVEARPQSRAIGTRVDPVMLEVFNNLYVLNAPYNGGTHLPDVTVITPVFDGAGKAILFYVGSRGHHADIGGITPGSMPPRSKVVEEEGVLIDNFLLVEEGALREAETAA